MQALLGAFAALAILMTMFNVISLLQLATSQRSLGARAVQAQTEATRLRADAARVRSQVDAKELEVVSVAAREANSIIDMRAFSWSELLAHFETTLPENVRITAVAACRQRRIQHRHSCRGPSDADLEKFLDALEMTGAFHNVLATDEQTTSDGLLEAVIDGKPFSRRATRLARNRWRPQRRHEELPVTDTSHGMRLTRRVIQEHKRSVVLIAGGLVLNVLLYVVVVRPLARSVANIEQSTLAAEQSRVAAQTEFGRANGTLTGKDRATKELATFYSAVLAQDLSGARRLTYGRVQRLAEQFRLEYQRSTYEPVESAIARSRSSGSTSSPTGNYSNMRSFIHAIETAPEFVVIENISLAEGSGEGSYVWRLTSRPTSGALADEWTE